MNFELSQDQQTLREVVRGFFASEASLQTTQIKTAEDSLTAWDHETWSLLSTQLGLTALHIPEQYGGQGFGLIELGIALEESGRVLFNGPLMAAALTSSLLVRTENETLKARWLPQLGSGSATAANIIGADDKNNKVAATATGDGFELSGKALHVPFANSADVMLVAVANEVFFVDNHDRSVHVSTVKSIDPTRPLSEITFEHATAVKLVPKPGAGPIRQTATCLELLFVAAEQLGGAESVLELTIEHLKDRHQFGKPIGSFQAVKHSCANLVIKLEGARVSVQHAFWAAENDDEEQALLAQIAAVACTEAFSEIATEAIQLHGGIGFTWEHPAHLFFKRAKSSNLLFGQPSQLRQTIAELVLA